MALRFGIIGCSSVARRRFLPALQKSAFARLERVGSRDPAKAAEYAKNFGCTKAGDYDAVLNDPEVDAVYLSFPVTFREEWTRKAAARKKHVLCEKPAFPNLAIAQEMACVCQREGVRLMEGYMFRYHPQHAVAKRWLGEERIGKVRLFSGEYYVPNPPPQDIRHRADLGGGVFRDALGYPAAAAMLLLDSKPVSVFCQAVINPANGTDDAVAMLVTFAGGELAQLSAIFGARYRAMYSLCGTLGRIEVAPAYAVNADHRGKVILETAGGIEESAVEPVDQFQLMIDDFAQQISGNAMDRKDFEGDLLRQHEFMDAAWESYLEQRLLRLT